MQRFRGKVALITGAASGIGKATAERLAAEGADVAVADINIEAAEAVAKHIAAQHGIKAVAILFDAASHSDCERVVRETVSALGRLDILHNNGGIMDWGQSESWPDERWDRMININLSAVFRVSKHALPHLLESGGCIVNTSSAAGLVGTPYAFGYAAAKAGVIGLTKSMAIELADRGVRVNAICPGAVETPLNVHVPLPDFADMNKIARLSPKTNRASKPEEIAGAVAYLVSADACNVTGIALSVDGGQVAG